MGRDASRLETVNGDHRVAGSETAIAVADMIGPMAMREAVDSADR